MGWVFKLTWKRKASSPPTPPFSSSSDSESDVEEGFEPHRIKESLPVDTTSICWGHSILMGFQHFLVMLGTTVLIPTIVVGEMGGSNEQKAILIQNFLFVAGITTFLHTFLGTRLPVVMGGSYSFIIPCVCVAFSKRAEPPHERFMHSMRAIQGSLLIASAFQLLFSFIWLVKVFGRLLNPLTIFPLVTLTGCGFFTLSFPQFKSCLEVILPYLSILLFVSHFLPYLIKPKLEVIQKYGSCWHYALKSNGTIFQRFSILISIPIFWLVAYVLSKHGAYDHKPTQAQTICRSDRSGLIKGAPWVRVPRPFQWGPPIVYAGDAFSMIAASFVAAIESMGVLIAASRYSGTIPIPPRVLTRGIIWQGISTLLGGIVGTVGGTTISVANAGLLGLTLVATRRVIQISAGFMIFFSIFGKFGALFASIPFSIWAAFSCILYAYVVSAGIGFLQFCNLNSFRLKFIVGFSIFMGLYVPRFFDETWVTSPSSQEVHRVKNILQVILSSPATVGTAIAVFLDLTYLRGHRSTRNDSGRHWWAKFRTAEACNEFYHLPWGIEKLMA